MSMETGLYFVNTVTSSINLKNLALTRLRMRIILNIPVFINYFSKERIKPKNIV